MAEPVAQFTAALITLANKGAHLALRAYREQGYAEGKRLVEQIFPGTCDTPVGILGAGGPRLPRDREAPPRAAWS